MSGINVFEPHIAKDFDVYFQSDAALETKVDVRYLKYGVDEIDKYIAQKVVPELDEYVAEEKSRLTSYHIDLEDSILSLEGTNVAVSTVDLNDFPFAGKCVTLTDEQTIDAVKTFIQNPIISKNEAPTLVVQNTSTMFGSAPESDQISGVSFMDSTGTVLGSVQHKVCADASVVSSLSCSNLEATESAEIGIGYDENGDVYTKAPTPASSDNSTQIATTAFVKDVLPTVNNATLTIQKNGINVETFTANAGSDVTVNITVPTDTNDLTNGAGFITGINSNDIATALGYTAANDSEVVKLSSDQTIAGTKTFSSSPVVPTPVSSDNSTKIATTAFIKSVLSANGAGLAAFSKGNNGYYKFDNGLIIQWGRATSSPVIFPTPFSSNSSFAVATAYVANDGTEKAWGNVYSSSTTQFNWTMYNTSSQVHWLAIGY